MVEGLGARATLVLDLLSSCAKDQEKLPKAPEYRALGWLLDFDVTSWLHQVGGGEQEWLNL